MATSICSSPPGTTATRARGATSISVAATGRSATPASRRGCSGRSPPTCARQRSTDRIGSPRTARRRATSTTTAIPISSCPRTAVATTSCGGTTTASSPRSELGTPFAADSNVDYKSDNEFYHCWCAAHAGSCPAAESSPKVDCTNYSWTPGFDDQPARNAGNTFSTACADLDNDGDLDLIHATIRHWHIGNSADPSQILRNEGGLSFSRVANDEHGLLQPHTGSDWNEGNITVAAFDFDNDGKKDIYLGSSDYPDTWGRLYHQTDDGFEDLTDRAGAKHYHAVSHTSVDIDGDGDLDLIVVTSAMRCSGDKKCAATPTLKVYRNDAGQERNFVQFALKGTGSNASAIGAKVTVTAGGVKQVQEVNGGYGTFGMQNDTMLTFGLGGSCAVDKVEVRWPNGDKTVQAFDGIVANHLAQLTEGEAKPKYLR